MPAPATKNKDNVIYIALKKQFGSVDQAARTLGFCVKTLRNLVDGRPMTESLKKRIVAAGYSPDTFKKKRKR